MLKRVEWIGSSRTDLKRFPEPVQHRVGFAIYQAELGHRRRDAKPLGGFGSGALEVVSCHDGDTFRGRSVPSGSRLPSTSCTPSRRKPAGASQHRRPNPTSSAGASPPPSGTTVTRTVETYAMEPTETTVERGCGNVFADLGLPDADAHFVKAELVSRIDDIVRKRGITQTEAARLLGLSQPDVSRLLRGDFREYPLERLFRLLTALGRDVDIIIRQPRSATGGKLRIAATEAG